MPHRSALNSPRIVTRYAVRVTAIAAPASLAMVAWWGFYGRVHFFEWRWLILMLYLLLLSAMLGSAVVAVVGRCFTAVDRAFSAGYQTGLQVGHATEAMRPHGPGGPGGRHLRSVPPTHNGTEH